MKLLRVTFVNHPVLVLGTLGLLLGWISQQAGVGYDASGFKAVLFWSSRVLVLPFWAAQELLFSMFEGGATTIQTILGIALGFALCFALDAAIRSLRRRAGRPKPTTEG